MQQKNNAQPGRTNAQARKHTAADMNATLQCAYKRNSRFSSFATITRTFADGTTAKYVVSASMCVYVCELLHRLDNGYCRHSAVVLLVLNG